MHASYNDHPNIEKGMSGSKEIEDGSLKLEVRCLRLEDFNSLQTNPEPVGVFEQMNPIRNSIFTN